ncbi:enoyl-CoA hydratase-related protein [Siminovitchia sp. FSL H7-0308]|uniref:Enoyl-CoA hydratase/carnithine racemase n=1 Tax=Siminovitchia thermophila TaxID=1245522 RepID=A0ABS2R280_9BACI|nr:enoyl-CoA hydratase-related protein [Siminovitchia thermophila]MBM7713495.1 enoyl-CoA hydratase/carnithine racemase [Siminovitchia thermophila]
MAYETVLYEQSDHVVKIQLNLPKLRNPLTEQLAGDLVNAIRRADRDKTVRAIVVTGSGKAFSAGGNLKEFKENFVKPVPQLYDEGIKSNELFRLGAEVSTPIITAVNGPALGGGTGLAAMSHIAIASDQATLGLTELRLGLVPFVILPWVRRAVGERKVMEMMLTAKVLSAKEAEEVNLVHKVVPHAQLEEETWKVAETICSYSPLAVRLALDAFYTTEQIDLAKSFDLLSTLRLVSFRSEDLKEGASAFLEKRKPEWKGK